jgi:hypothetical protein
MSDQSEQQLLENVRALALDVERMFPGAVTDVQPFPSGAVMLDIRQGGRLFVLAYIPSSGWFGVDEVRDGDGFGDQYRFGSQSLDDAAKEVRRLLGG